MANKSVYPAVFYPWEGGNGFTVEIPDLPGCVSEGESLPEAIEMAQDAASGWILGELEDGNDVPEASNLKDITVDEDGGFKQYLVLDIADYARKHGKKTVKKNLTIPAWLATRAQERNINFSQVLQDALIDYLGIAQ
ncbi:MAG: type II toxin-antitoxin system HicB family antitoxin [Christensenella sp.]|uniref:type II toxin-antitoxin system HicB family antitoxin n=1 Tax=Christensenella sp. TaxID=1935934 RepID=UPI002B21ACF6|nr:type II toxin-antitoxin system HicB family antitoxin [Christensenella sp.]MEA5004712.1 type II toxin-antitoxin system HicB family antitoxin [Christensenella sp.]